MIAAYLRLLRAVTRHWPWWALFSSALMLAIAHAFQTFGGLAPCLLCLKQREVYWIAMGVAATGIVAGPLLKRPVIVRLICAVLAVVFLVGMGIAIWHAGAEWKWWPGPKACAPGSSNVSTSGLNSLLAGAPQPLPSCEVAAWRFLGLSMAGWNVLISLKLAILSILATLGFGDRR